MDAEQAVQEVAGPTEYINPGVPPVSLWRLAWLWFMVGLQSFGGGTATLFLIRRMAVDQYKWLTPDEFTRDWSLVQASPGINLLCMVILVGQRVAGFGGALVTLSALMLPSIALTVVMTALYASFRDLPVIQAALRGVVPATVGLGLVLTYRMVTPLLAAGRREGLFALIVHVAILIGASATILLWQLPVVTVLCGAGVINGARKWLHRALVQSESKVA